MTVRVRVRVRVQRLQQPREATEYGGGREALPLAREAVLLREQRERARRAAREQAEDVRARPG